MARSTLSRLVPGGSAALYAILDPALGRVLPPIRSEIFGPQRFAQHGHSLGLAHRAGPSRPGASTFFPRLDANIQMLRQAHRTIGTQASSGYDLSPAAEWLLDNFHLIEAQLKAIHEGLPRAYFRTLPKLLDEPLAGLPRVYSIAWAFVAHTDGAFDASLLTPFLSAYQSARDLRISELWALPTTLRVVLIENLRRLAEHVAANKAAREVANLCCNPIERYAPQELEQLLALLAQRGVDQVFLAHLALRLQERDMRDMQDSASTVSSRPDWYLAWVQDRLPNLSIAQTQQRADQAADNLSVSNALTSLRAIGDANWPEIVAHTSALMRLMLSSALFSAEATQTRDQSLHRIEQLALRHGCSESIVATALLHWMGSASSEPDVTAQASYWLQGAGQAKLTQTLGLQRGLSRWATLPWRSWAQRAALPLYLSVLVLGTLGLVAWLLHHSAAASPGPLSWLGGLVALAMLFPASQTVVAVINRLISESVRPQHLPRLALANGIPAQHRVLVVIPGLLTSTTSTQALAHRLLLHYLANPEPHAQFALLTDWTDANHAERDSDAAQLDFAVQQIEALNQRYPGTVTGVPRFILLHRARQFSASEQCWIGWERKRGKLEQLIAAMAEGTPAPFIDLGPLSQIAADTPYLLTLDSDTQLPPGRLRELVAVAAHPQNRPRLDPKRRRLLSGYSILQPRVVTPLPSLKQLTPYHWLFAGQCGIDPYSAASSEVYQDVFGEGSFCGKGLLQVQAMHALLSNRLPENQVLSHDLLEGALARCAAVSDITLVEEAPFQADVAAARLHRWTRGDWQLLPFLCRPQRFPMAAINRWKLLDNLRRSLVAPMSLLLLLLALGGAALTPWAALALVFAALSAGPLMGALAGMWPQRSDLVRAYFYRHAGIELCRALLGAVWLLGQLLQQACLNTDAVLRTLYRMAFSHRQLLQWTTAASAQDSAPTGLLALLRQHWRLPLVALLVLSVLLALPSPAPWLALGLCLAWGSCPIAIWWVSRPQLAADDAALSLAEQIYLEGIARDSWRFFERCVGPAEQHLPPDNLQTLPYDIVAHRTSPTNIGLYLLSVACARQFGWIGTEELISRMAATLSTLQRLPRHRGHFLNWYDSQTQAALLPMYVSTVDSGNLCAHLLTVAQACRERAQAPYQPDASRHALRLCRQRLLPLMPLWADALPGLLGDAALVQLLALTGSSPDPLAACQRQPAHFVRLLHAADAELAGLPDSSNAPAAQQALLWLLGDWLATLHSAWRDQQAEAKGNTPARSSTEAAAQRLRALAQALEALAAEADFQFLYHPSRHLFHIGYRVAEQELDTGFYDLLASESRLTSLLAVAEGQVPVKHWSTLGRPFFAEGARAGLLSWSGSMFEYLMPSLVLEEPHGSVLNDACHAALQEQMTFAQTHDVPWGISESAYAGNDHTLAYQYAPQGVPRLALRRSPPGDLVITPYATALAAQLAPRWACRNFAALEKLGARMRYGFIEALDFSPAHQTGAARFTPVSTFMAHHQGMSIVALLNVLQAGAAQRWGMAHDAIEAVASLLHERAPREVPQRSTPMPGPQALSQEKNRLPSVLREVLPGAHAVEPTHLLSNGRYSVALRANGAGWSRWGRTDLTRWRDDALRDEHGSFIYLRPSGAPLVSITQHPAADPAAHYRSTFHADRVCFDAAWRGYRAHTTVWVSPEDDIEFRQVELFNLSEQVLEIELLSAFEVSLNSARADEAHPAFSNLFVRAQWLAQQQALVLERRPRLATEQGLQMAHFVAETDPQVIDVRHQSDRQSWRGRNRDASQPLADFSPAADTNLNPDAEAQVLDTGLDPVCALSVRLRIAPLGSARLTFATAAHDNGDTLRAVIDKYRQASCVQRASLMSATLTSLRLRALQIGPDNFAAIQSLNTALLLLLTRPQAQAQAQAAAHGVCDRRLLWRFGISGDRPLVLVSASLPQGIGLLRALAQALRLWSWGCVACDLVIINAEPSSYLMALQQELALLRDLHAGEAGAETERIGAPITGLWLLRADDLSADELSSLQAIARLRLAADGRPLSQQVQEWNAWHQKTSTLRQNTEIVPVDDRRLRLNPAPLAASQGQFGSGTEAGNFAFEVQAQQRPTRPWINVLANPQFGAQISEAGSGYSWALNSRLNQLTAWSNDPVADPPSEWFLLQDQNTREIWSVAPGAWADPASTYQVVHRQGLSSITHQRAGIRVSASWCVDASSSVKQISLHISNQGPHSRHLRVIGMAEWIMGSERIDRATVHTRVFRAPLPSPQRSDQAAGQQLTALLCTQLEQSTGLGGGTAFLALAGPLGDEQDWTCDRRECFDAQGQRVLPERFGRQQGRGLDPCAALASALVLAPGAQAQRVFLLGYASDPQAAQQLALQAAAIPSAQRIEQVQSQWADLLGAVQVQSPDPLFDALVNHWLLYQAITCRLWAKCGFYQAGGATGFRDQLQDSMALAWVAPDMLRDQILLCAARQFAPGDVQHWWHAPTGAGVRSHISDDLLWLAHACVHYLQATGDSALLDEQVPFIEGRAIAEGAEDAYFIPDISNESVTVYEHAARAIDHSLRVGVHGLPLMGSGDWNDGMNRVGSDGRGESVWLGWFLCQLVRHFAPLAHSRGEAERAARWEQAAQGWQAALDGPAWDGQWYLRAFFDAGQPLGSHTNAEARIDLIAQAWAVLSQAAAPERQRIAMDSMAQHLVDDEWGLIKLLIPPLALAQPSAGYIQAYPPGIRENGGQYSHAGVWALMAQAELALREASAGHASQAISDLPYRYFTYLSPAHRAKHPKQAAVYGLEPYVMAGDVYTQPPYVGRGGWSWYTGAAAWMHRAAIESIFGLKLGAQSLCFTPCLPAYWPQAELTLQRDGRRMRFILCRATPDDALAATAQWQAQLLRPGQPLAWRELPPESCWVLALLDDA